MDDRDPTPIERRFLEMIESLKRSDAVNVNAEKKVAVSEVVVDSTAGFSTLKELFGVTLDPALKAHHVRYWELGIHWYPWSIGSRNAACRRLAARTTTGTSVMLNQRAPHGSDAEGADRHAKLSDEF